MSKHFTIDPRVLTSRLLRFFWRVLKRFYYNKGLLLAGAVGYNALLSTVPLLAVSLALLSQVVDPETLTEVVSAELDIALPGQGPAVAQALEQFMAERHVFGWVGFGVLLFFSTIAFRILEDAMAVIFRHHRRIKSRHPLISAMIPFVYVMSISVGLLFLTVLATMYETVEQLQITIFTEQVSLRGYSLPLFKMAGFVGEVALFASFYRVLPMVRVRYKLALIGGFVAAVLWEITRAILVWYFASISLVNVVYGSLATVIIVLLSMEIASVIILLAAQVIAEIEVSSESGLKWYQEPDLIASGLYQTPQEVLDVRNRANPPD